MNTKYGYIIEDLRKNVFEDVVNELFKTAEVSIPKIDEETDSRVECAKAFLIWLAISRFGISIESDIVLCHMGLLKGYSTITGLQDRRKKLFIESNYLFSGRNGTFESKDMTENELNYQANQFNKVDKPLLEKMMQHFDSLDNKPKSYIQACNRYLEITHNSHMVRQVRLPIPSFSTRLNVPIRHIKRLDNPNFCGREKELNEIDNFFSSKQSRKILILSGMGGVGKTQISLKYAYLHQQEYSTVVWLDAMDFKRMIDHCRKFLLEYTKLGKDNLSDSEDVRVQFRRFINSRSNSLLIFDNADYVCCSEKDFINSQKKLASFIPTGNVHVIITTRNNNIFSNLKRVSVDVFEQNLAVEYLYNKTGLEPNNDAVILVEKLGYLPLALDYVGAYIFEQKISYKDYLNLWDKYGTALFDREGYAETTIRQAFKITLDKLRENPEEYDKVLYLLEICAKYKLEYFPIKSFSEYYKGLKDELLQHYRNLIEQGKNPISSFEDGFVGKSSVHKYRMIEACDDYSEKWECISEENKGNIIIDYPSKSFSMLQDELERGEAIRSLTKYSLVNWDGNVMIMHPLLAEIIRDEFAVGQKDDFSIYSFKAEIYDYHGDKESYNKYERLALENRMNIVELAIDSTPSKPINPEFNSVELLLEETVKLYPIFVRLIKYADEDMIKRGMRIWFKITKYIYGTDDITHLKEKMLYYERIFYNRLSWQLGHFIVWRRYPTPSEREQSQTDYIYECTQIRDFTDSPRLSSAKAAIDVWDIDETDSYKLDGDPSWRVSACEDISKYNLE